MDGGTPKASVAPVEFLQVVHSRLSTVGVLFQRIQFQLGFHA
jgi:hypothetical protein